MRAFAPKSCSDTHARVVSNCNRSLVPVLTSRPDLNLSDPSIFSDDADYLNHCLRLNHLLELRNRRELIHRAFLDRLGSIIDLADLRPLIKGDLVIILNRRELLVRHLYLASTHLIHASLPQNWVVFARTILEECRLDLTVAPIDEIAVEQVALAASVVPRFHGVLLGYSDLDGPVVGERVQARDRDVASVIVIATERHSLE